MSLSYDVFMAFSSFPEPFSIPLLYLTYRHDLVSSWLHDSLERMEAQEGPVILATDGAYPTRENQMLADEKHGQIVSTNMAGRKANDVCADFVMNKEKTSILQCPAGMEPTSCSAPNKNGQMRATFPAACCSNYPNRDKCPAKIGRRVSSVVISASSISRARIQRHARGEECRAKIFEKARSMEWETDTGTLPGDEMIRILAMAPQVGELTAVIWLASRCTMTYKTNSIQRRKNPMNQRNSKPFHANALRGLSLSGTVIDRTRRMVPRENPTTEIVTYTILDGYDRKFHVDDYAQNGYHDLQSNVCFPVSIKAYNRKNGEPSYTLKIQKTDTARSEDF